MNRRRKFTQPECPIEPSESATPIPTPGGGASVGLVAAIRFLFPFHRRDADRPGAGSAATWFVAIGLMVGVVWVGVFRLTWKLYGETASMRVIPALSVVILECLLTGPFLALGLARTAHLLAGDRPQGPPGERMSPLSPVGVLVLMLAVLSEWVLIVSVPHVSPWWPEAQDWRHYFSWMYPQPIYRPLLLAPLWGRWGILVAATVGRTARWADAETIALCQSLRPLRLLRHGVIPFMLTAIYCSRSLNFLTGAILGLCVFCATYVVAVIMARRGLGQTRDSLFAAGQIAQLAFLALYRAFWPLIHG